jgi:alkanesulfonate monooxygenase SsuD/methylene tetrahydromethanopterin reductase-like flavin-dependent oxidoreductase (luciferase family)
MRFGIFSNGQRLKNSFVSYDEDVREIVIADRLGFAEAWISEHTGQTWMPHAVPAAELLISRAASLTEKILMGPAVRRISLYPPQMVAIEGAVCDHLTHGRYMFGFGNGPPATNYAQWGIDPADSPAMTVEAIDLIMQCWLKPEPFDFDGKFYHGRGINLFPKPYQKNIPIAVATSKGALLKMAAKHGFRLLTTWSMDAATIKMVAAAFDDECRGEAGISRRRDVTVARSVHVADSDGGALAQVEADWRQAIHYNSQFLAKPPSFVQTGGKLGLTFEHLVENGNIIVGSPTTVATEIRRLFHATGGFGTFLVVCGKDIGTAEQRDRSLHLFAEAVMPKLLHLDAGLDETSDDAQRVASLG